VAITAVAAIPLLAASGVGGKAEGGPEMPSWEEIRRLLLPLAALPVLFLGSRRLLPVLFRKAAAARAPEAFSLLALGACLSVAMLAHAAGASLAIGAFLGGLVLCQTPLSSQIIADLSILRNLALGFFFVTIGMLVDLKFVAEHAPALILALACMAAGKAVLASASLLAIRLPLTVAVPAGFSLAQASEFSFVLGRQAADSGLLDQNTLRFFLVTGVVSMIVTPLLMEAGPRVGRRLADLMGRRKGKPASCESAVAAAGGIESAGAIVVGYGPVGRTLTRILMDFGIRPIIIELNLDTVNKLKARNFPVVYGDAGRREILEKAGVCRADYLLVTLPDLPARMSVVATAVAMNPRIRVLTRARYLGERAMLEEAGASAVSYEEAEVAVSLADTLLREIGAKKEDIEREKARIRAEIAVRTGFTLVMPASDETEGKE
jgi:CPA2 family monovalent cation:H+ antiporter-2